MTQINNFDQARSILSTYAPTTVEEAYSLDRMQDLMKSLGNPQDKLKIIHVAGTSGKSSTSYFIASLLDQAGQSVGLTVSPHIDEVNERLQINLKPLDEKTFCKTLAEFIDIVEKTGIQPTYFELLVAMAYWYFAKQKVDYAVVEVGLGGLLDGTNVNNREDKICVITDIGLDHIHILGGSLSEIAEQKAGIIQSHNAVFTHNQAGEIMESIKKRIIDKHAQLHELSSQHDISFNDIAPIQNHNFDLAKGVYDYLRIRDGLPKLTDPQLSAAAHTIIPARIEQFKYKNKTVIIDGSHNAQKMTALADGLKKLYPHKTIAALVSFAAHKEPYAEEALSELLPLVDKLIITSFNSQQDIARPSIQPSKLAEMAKSLNFDNVEVINDPKIAFKKLLDRPEQVLVVTGSFYLLNHIRPTILK